MEYEATRKFAAAMDAEDELRKFRNEFNFPRAKGGEDCIYLCGNSLGLQPKRAAQFVREELEDWATLGVEAHFHARRPWLPYHRQATPGLAKLCGALPAEVIGMNTLTVNLHLMMTSFYRPTAKRYRILIESSAFPSDRFAVQSQLRLHGFDPATGLVEWHPRAGGSELHTGDLEKLLADNGDSIALLLLPGVQYYSGQVLDMPAICRIAKRAGCVVGFDLAHAIGNVPLDLHDWAPDFAAWCSYKYLNSGPGAIGGAFVHSRHLDDAGTPKLLGWWGHDEATRFAMANSFTPAPGAELWQLSNPPILSYAPMIASLQIFEEAGMKRLRKKSLLLTGYLDFLLQQRFAGQVASVTPQDARGCQLSLQVIDKTVAARAVFESLERHNVMADWREPNVIRVAPVPLYNGYNDVFEFCERLQAALHG
ncbi:MAG: kynureninase [Gammaproteobacteria bacterium]|nr:kynureninase [Gammaproteobacteria bacterium]MDH4315736.1 kynureninase [Gammaproteobacteria bacterium]MDH5214158.1 kynureninase [Gammaproteobacteria bacterium]